MNSKVDPEAPPPGETDAGARWPTLFSRDAALGVVSYTYQTPEEPEKFSFQHEKANGMLVITRPDGISERFRDILRGISWSSPILKAVKYAQRSKEAGRCTWTRAGNSEKPELGREYIAREAADRRGILG